MLPIVHDRVTMKPLFKQRGVLVLCALKGGFSYKPHLSGLFIGCKRLTVALFDQRATSRGHPGEEANSPKSR